MMKIPLEDAVAWMRGGALLAYPTETVWGLGADARSDAAVAALCAFKRRPIDAPISILVTGLSALAPLGFRVGPLARRLARDFWPGPLTLVLPCEGRFAAGVARGDGAVGVRCSPHPVAHALAALCEREGFGPLTATSCNASGAPAARSRDEAQRVCGEDPRLRVLAGGEDAGSMASSTVVDVTGPRPMILRQGALASRELLAALAEPSAA